MVSSCYFSPSVYWRHSRLFLDVSALKSLDLLCLRSSWQHSRRMYVFASSCQQALSHISKGNPLEASCDVHQYAVFHSISFSSQALFHFPPFCLSIQAEFGFNEHHQSEVINYMRFARSKRVLRLKTIDSCFEELKESRWPATSIFFKF